MVETKISLPSLSGSVMASKATWLKIERYAFLMLCIIGLSLQLYTLFTEFKTSSIPVISYEVNKRPRLPGVSVCVDWPYYLKKDFALQQLRRIYETDSERWKGYDPRRCE